MGAYNGERLERLLDEELTDVAAAAAAHLADGASSCSITIELDHGPRRTASSDPLSAACDDVEIETRVGPCLEAMSSGSVVLVEDIAAAAAWPAWSRTARAAGFGSSAAFPAHLRSSATAAVNVYRPWPGSWDRDTLLRADVYAQEVAHVVDLCVEVAELEEARRAMQVALLDRREVDHAIGAVMVVNQCDAPTALSLLMGSAVNRSVTLAEVARSVLDALISEGSRR